NWSGEDNSFDLAISATAFHFIEPKYGYEKVNRLLKNGGSIGFFWTIHVQQYDELHAKIRDIYQRYASDLDDAKKPGPAEVISDRLRLTKEQGFFGNITVKEYRWVDTYTSNDYISLLNTHSGHRQLPERTRNKLFASIKELIDVHGGCIDKQQLVALFLGSKTQI
ncbi:MAG TPA: class I SAM-dependent methyltransferase, partial [Firmicutes bacterium]|nr:class I SAM-dependent methyltransferase [Bacillota bacterium]